MIVQSGDEISLAKIAESGQCFRWLKSGEEYCIPHEGKMLRARQIDERTLELDCTEEAFDAVWKPYFDLDTDYGKICERISQKADPFLYEAIRAQAGVRILRQNAWEMLITSIITQNRNIPAIRNSVELLSQKADTRCTDEGGRTFFAFPTPDQLDRMPDEDLSECRLGYRMRYVRCAARAVASGDLDLENLSFLPDEECVEKLTALCGVGVKVAACIMLFGLHRLNAFPVDVWMKRILENEYPDGYSWEAYSPYNGIYQQYMFAYYREKALNRS